MMVSIAEMLCEGKSGCNVQRATNLSVSENFEIEVHLVTILFY
jgi:hypothetical protein